MEIDRADEVKVKALLDHLVKAFEDYCNDRDGDVDFIDAFMAVHNFHCVILLDIERRAKMDVESQLFWRQCAVDAFERAMETKPAWKQK